MNISYRNERIFMRNFLAFCFEGFSDRMKARKKNIVTADCLMKGAVAYKTSESVFTDQNSNGLCFKPVMVFAGLKHLSMG